MQIKRFILKFLAIICLALFISPAYTQNKSVEKVFWDLIKAKGDYSKDTPELIIETDGNNVASQYKNIISIDQKAIDICMQFGKDSLNLVAYLLSHELTHYYSRRNMLTIDKVEAYKEFSFMENIKLINKDVNRRVELEAEADLKGGLNAYIAGYNALENAPKLLDKIYKSYHKDDNLTGYPPLEERKKICKEQIKKLNELKIIFDASTYAFISGNYKIAQDCLKKILQKEYNSREMYNNLGLAYLHDALNEIKHKLTFIYPFEFDTDSRLNLTLERNLGFDKDEITRKLTIALRKFEHALNLDRKYAPARINMACTYSILAELNKDQPENFVEYIQEAENQLKNNFINELDSTIVSAILAFQKGKDSKAKNLFEKAARKGSIIANNNIAIIISDSTHKTNFKDSFSSYRTPSIDKIDRNEIVFGIYPDWDYEIYLDKYDLYVKMLKHSTLYVFKHGNSTTLFQSMKDLSPTFNLKNSVDIKTLNSILKEEPVYQNGTVSQFICYPNNNLVFSIKNGEIDDWFLYEMSN